MEGAYVVELHEKMAELEARLRMAETEKAKLLNQMGMLMKALDKLYIKEQELNQAISRIHLLERKLMLMAGKIVA
jgi:predicted RNase H-like nuclease (RuvC/YqgF family)